jgi:hypothetical protein
MPNTKHFQIKKGPTRPNKTATFYHILVMSRIGKAKGNDATRIQPETPGKKNYHKNY